MLALSIETRGVQLLVEGEFYEAYPDSQGGPGEPEAFEVYKILTRCGDNITALFDDNTAEISAVCLKTLHDMAIDARASRTADERLTVL